MQPGLSAALWEKKPPHLLFFSAVKTFVTNLVVSFLLNNAQPVASQDKSSSTILLLKVFAFYRFTSKPSCENWCKTAKPQLSIEKSSAVITLCDAFF